MSIEKFRMLEFYGKFLGLTFSGLQNIKRFMQPKNDDELLEILWQICKRKVIGGIK